MLRSAITRPLILFVCYFAWACGCLATQTAQSTTKQLKFVVILTRHGVRSPTGDPARYDAYSAAPWPKWDVPPGYLTAHGFELMRFFGAYDRTQLAAEGLLKPAGCADASYVTILADSDERTRETGRALAEGMFPGCPVAVHALAEGDPNPIFHSIHARVGKPDNALALAAFEGRVGGNAANLTEAYRPQLKSLDSILGGCGKVPATNPHRSSIFDMPKEAAKSKNDSVADLHGPLSLASSMAEALLLEYADGVKGKELGWGCLDENGLGEIMQLHTAEADFTERTPTIARMNGSNLLEHILDALEQAASGNRVSDARTEPSNRVLFLVGHDTNIVSVAGLLDLNWIIDGRADDTPPGGALIFELWRAPDGSSSVRLFYSAQTLRQMRDETPLTPANPPERLSLFVPGCSRSDMSCALDSFAATVQHTIDPAYVKMGSLEQVSAAEPAPR